MIPDSFCERVDVGWMEPPGAAGCSGSGLWLMVVVFAPCRSSCRIETLAWRDLRGQAL